MDRNEFVEFVEDMEVARIARHVLCTAGVVKPFFRWRRLSVDCEDSSTLWRGCWLFRGFLMMLLIFWISSFVEALFVGVSFSTTVGTPGVGIGRKLPALEGATIGVVIATIEVAVIVVVATIVEIATIVVVRVAILVVVAIVGIVELRFTTFASIVISGF